MMPVLLKGEQPDVTYYSVVRSTLTAVDGQRLTASIYGTTIPLTILIGAATVSHHLDKTTFDFGPWQGALDKLPIGYMFGSYLCFIAVMIAEYFIAKIDLFNHFIKTSVTIGKRIENILNLDSDICLTERFEDHKTAGDRGDKLSKFSVRVVQFTAILGLVTDLKIAIVVLRAA